MAVVACSFGAEDKKALTEKKDRASYALGQYTGHYWKQQGLTPEDVDVDLFINAFRDVLGGKEAQLSQQDMMTSLKGLSGELRARMEEKRKVQGEKNKKEGDTFLAENKTKPDVRITSSGLQYKIITEGTGPTPTTNDTVTVNYRGTLTDGTEFDSSYKRGQPATFQVNRVIKGWTEALLMMKPGSKWQLFIPSELAYGERGQGQNIAPNAVLLFEVELLSIKNPEPAPKPQQPVTSDIIKVPSAEELKKGAKIEIIKPDQIEAEKAKEQQKANPPKQ